MKVFQILDGFCYYDATDVYKSVKDIPDDYYPPDVLFVDTHDHVFFGWGYDETKTGDARFIKPTPPEGFLYDDKTGTYYPDPDYVPPPDPTEELREALADREEALEILGVEPEEVKDENIRTGRETSRG